MKLDVILPLLALAAIAASAAYALYTKHQMRKTLHRMERLLDAAFQGGCRENAFDESVPSALEAKLTDYLNASAVSERNLAEQKERIETLISDISHQTKTPIANVLLYAQLLSEQPLTPEGRACVAALNGQAEKLRFLIGALIKTSRLENGILALHPQREAVQPLLDDAAEQVLPRAEERGVTVEVLPSGDAPTAVIDRKWTAEALYNLVDNAVKYTPQGGRVTLSVSAFELFCRVDVADTGPGIPEEEQAKVFTRFYRSPSVSGEEGVGLGLYLSRQIAAAQGGYLKVSSAPGRGAVFSLFLPRET